MVVQWKPLVISVTRLKSLDKAVAFEKTLAQLKKNYPDAHCALIFKNPFELLIATILSAQCTDERVNKVTEVLFKIYPKPVDLAEAGLVDIEKIIHSAGFYKNKAKNLKATSQILVEKFLGRVPQQMDQLVELPGVGRKTANVVLGNAFNIASGVVVDTHVTRLSRRLGWVKTTNPILIEKQLNQLCQSKDWIMLSHYLISHGRAICKARSPSCEKCFLLKSCPQRFL